MALGVSRFAAIAVTLGLDPSVLAKGLISVESLLGGIKGEPYAARVWQMGVPDSWDAEHARGAVWQVARDTSAEEIWRALAVTFSGVHHGCGDVLVMSLAAEAHEWAQTLVAILVQGMETGGISGLASVPVYLWHNGAPDTGPTELLLDRIRNSVKAGACSDRSSDVQTVFKMRLNGGATLAAEWDSADGERIRLHDLSVMSSAEADRPSSFDEMRAIALVERVHRNPNLLYSLPFLPVSQKLLDALMGAAPMTRAITGLLTPAELHAWRPAWRRPTADGYRPTAAFTPLAAEPI